MNTLDRRVPTEFGPETQFEVKTTAAAVPLRAEQELRFEALERRLVAECLQEAWEPEGSLQVARAANEAAALAWVTPYPLLVFPVLFEEKAQAAALQAERQAQVFQRSRELLAV
jgi:hypothetical protein